MRGFRNIATVGRSAAATIYTQKLNVDGVDITPTVGTLPPNDDGMPPGLEVFSRGGSVFADALARVDDLCIWNRPLSDADVADYLINVIPSGPKLLLDFSNAGDLGQDQSGEANHFTNNGVSEVSGEAQCDGFNLELPVTSSALLGTDMSNNGFSIAGRYRPTAADIASGFALVMAAFLGGSGNGTWGIDLRVGGLTCYMHVGSGVYNQIVGGSFVADALHSFVWRVVKS